MRATPVALKNSEMVHFRVALSLIIRERFGVQPIIYTQIELIFVLHQASL